MSLSEVSILLSRFSQCTLMVVGDLMLDEYLWGHIERISPEAPVPVLTVVRRDYTLGGAGNVAKNLRSLGAGVVALGAVGTDDAGACILKELDELGSGRRRNQVRFIISSSGKPGRDEASCPFHPGGPWSSRNCFGGDYLFVCSVAGATRIPNRAGTSRTDRASGSLN